MLGSQGQPPPSRLPIPRPGDPVWHVAAIDDDATVAASAILAKLVGSGSTPTDRATLSADLLTGIEAFGWKRAELLEAVLVIPLDPEAAHNFNKGVSGADFARAINASRARRNRGGTVREWAPPDDVRRLPDGRKVRREHLDFHTGRPTALSLLVRRHALLPKGCSDDNGNYPPQPPALATRVPSPAERRRQRERAERKARVEGVRRTDAAWDALPEDERQSRLDAEWAEVQRTHAELAELGREALATALVNQAKQRLGAEVAA